MSCGSTRNYFLLIPMAFLLVSEECAMTEEKNLYFYKWVFLIEEIKYCLQLLWA